MTNARRKLGLGSIAGTLGTKVAALRKIAADVNTSYSRYPKKKPSGGRRWISTPSDELKELQGRLRERILEPLASTPELLAVLMRDPLRNACGHEDAAHILMLDLKEAFPSTSARRVRNTLVRAGMDSPAARLITELTTYRDELPQGAPTSNALLDLVLRPVDRDIVRFCRGRGVQYTRYADNLAFSSEEPLNVVERFVRRKLGEYEFKINPPVYGGRSAPVDITGVLTGKSLRVRPKTLEKTRARIIAADATGSEPEKASARGAMGWVVRVNPRQAAELVSQTLPPESELAKALAPRRRPPAVD
jgi:RNA-directed DNA polymerase